MSGGRERKHLRRPARLRFPFGDLLLFLALSGLIGHGSLATFVSLGSVLVCFFRLRSFSADTELLSFPCISGFVSLSIVLIPGLVIVLFLLVRFSCTVYSSTEPVEKTIVFWRATLYKLLTRSGPTDIWSPLFLSMAPARLRFLSESLNSL